MIDETGLLSAIANFCNLPTENYNNGYANPGSSDLETVENKLCKWTEESSGKILNDVIPDEFWSKQNLSKPSKVSTLCPENMDDSSVAVLLVVLWSRCSPNCLKEITVCLNYGATNWQTDETFKPIDWLRAYVKCIWVCVLYSRGEIRHQANSEKATKITTGTILLDAYALSQAASNSSEWFGILTSKQAPTVVLRHFINLYVMRRKLKAKFRDSVTLLSVFSDNDRKVVTHVSIATWFKKSIILPGLVRMMTLGPMTELAKEINKLRYTNDNDEATYQKVSEEAAHDLGLDLSDKEKPVACLLGVLAQMAQELIDQKKKSDNQG